MTSKLPPFSERMRAGYREMMVDKRVYAMTTIHFNHVLPGMDVSPVRAITDIETARRVIAEIVLEIERSFFGTRFIEDKIAAEDRFHAFCVVEKPGVSTHVHILWYIPSSKNDVGAFFQARSRSIFLHRNLNEKVPEAYRGFRRGKGLAFDDSHLGVCRRVQSRVCRFSVHTTEVDRPGGAAEYVTKELQIERNLEFGDQVFLLSEFHPTSQRTSSTRIWSYNNREKTSILLDLDKVRYR